MTAAGVGVVAGSFAAELLHDTAPTIALALALVIGLGLYVLVRFIAHTDANSLVRAAVRISATCFAMAYYLTLAGEMWRPHRAHAPIARIIEALTFLARMLFACALPVAIAGAAAWHAAGDARRRVPPGALVPLFVRLGLGAAAFAISLAVFIAAIAIVPPAVAGYVALSVIFVLPLACHGVWTYAYGRILTRWEVEMPESLVRGLADVRSRCGFQFDRVICLDGRYGNGRVGAVTSTLRSATLVVSEPLTNLLDRDELLAILAHETAHIELGHFCRKAVFGLLATAIGLACYVLLFMAVNPFIPRELRIGQVMVAAMLMSVGRRAYDSFVTRKHEREADAYAARAAGAGVLLRTLEKLGAGRSPIRVANRWTTHSTWEIRAQRLRDMAADENSV